MNKIFKTAFVFFSSMLIISSITFAGNFNDFIFGEQKLDLNFRDFGTVYYNVNDVNGTTTVAPSFDASFSYALSDLWAIRAGYRQDYSSAFNTVTAAGAPETDNLFAYAVNVEVLRRISPNINAIVGVADSETWFNPNNVTINSGHGNAVGIYLGVEGFLPIIEDVNLIANGRVSIAVPTLGRPLNQANIALEYKFNKNFTSNVGVSLFSYALHVTYIGPQIGVDFRF